MRLCGGIPGSIFVVGLTCTLLIGSTPLRSADKDKHPGSYSKEFEFVTNQEITLNETVGRVHFSNLTIESKELSGGRHRLLARLMASNPDGHDQAVVANVSYLDSDGDPIASDEVDKAVDERKSKTLTMRVYLERDSFSRIITIQLEIETLDD